MIRDRIRELRRVSAGTLRANPKNWRLHPERQRELLRGLLDEVGYADALLVRELADGSLELVDGHLRAEMTPDELVPVLVLDLSADEADKLLALHDPLAAMAEADTQALTSLVSQIETETDSIRQALDALVRDNQDSSISTGDSKELEIPSLYQVVAECQDEDQQRELFERLKSEGYACRLLNL